MFNLVVKNPQGETIAELEIGHTPISFGRATTCDVVLASTNVSRNHASLYQQDDTALVITDEGSANGVRVDDALIAGPTLVDETNKISISGFSLAITKKGRAPVEDKPAVALEAEDEDTSLEPHPEKTAPTEESRLKLVGRGGSYARTEFPLQKPLITIGRDANSDIPLEDPSISRQHAQIRLSQPPTTFTVVDLRSANGTFVDGQKVKRREVAESEIVRFGDLAFKVVLDVGPTVKTKTKISPRKRLFIAGGATGALLLAVIIAALLKEPPPTPPDRLDSIEILRKEAAKRAELLQKAEGHLSLRQWKLTITLTERVLKADPLSTKAKSLGKRAKHEQSQQAIFERAKKALALGTLENLKRAKQVFGTIDDKSIYMRDVRYKIKEINERIANIYREEGVNRCRARYWRQCQLALCEFFRLMPADRPILAEAELRRSLAKAESKLRRKRNFVACKITRTSTVLASHGCDPEALNKRYPDRKLRGALALYTSGKVDQAIRSISKLIKKKSSPQTLVQLNAIKSRLQTIRGKYQEGYTYHRNRDAKSADKEWTELLQADLTLVGPDVCENFFRDEVRRLLGELYYALGDEQFKLTRYRKAFGYWKRGKAINKRLSPLLNGLLALEKHADKSIRAGRALEASGSTDEARAKYELARDISENGRPMHKQALAALAKLP